MTTDEKAHLDREWSRRMAGIAVATLTVAEPQLLSLTPEQVTCFTEIVAQEIFIRLLIGDRPPVQPKLGGFILKTLNNRVAAIDSITDVVL